ncbi:MAG: putative amidophosphoribosyltransferase [Candidatus Saccharibacteria bacterium]|nr:putative amidophosphoribosyltransferase [Candidatus Saccharibacteria bacterium]
MIDSLLGFIAPHPCFECGKLGRPLCSNCKYNIESESFAACIICGRAGGKNGICISCRAPYSRAWCVGERTDALLRLIDAFKFERAKACYRPLADVLGGCLPELPSNTIVVPIPAVASHVRQRGYDHTLLISRRVAKLGGFEHRSVLARKTSSKQLGASRRDRIAQAKQAFRLDSPIASNRPYLIVDDIITTGSTLHYAAQILKDAGAPEVWVAVVARQVSTE